VKTEKEDDLLKTSRLKSYVPSSFRANSESQQSSGLLAKGKTAIGRMPPRGTGLAPSMVPKEQQQHSSSSYTNRVKVNVGGNHEQGNSLDFIASMIKRDILSQPKTSANHERTS